MPTDRLPLPMSPDPVRPAAAGLSSPAGERLTVVQMLPALDSGGVERGTLEIARALVEAGHRSVVISAGGRLVETLIAEGSEHVCLPVHRKSLRSLWQVRPLRECLAGLAPDVVHARSRVPAWLAWLALRGWQGGRRPAFVTTVHGLYSVNRYSAIMTRGERVVAVSGTAREYVLAHYPACPPERIEVIHRGVSAQAFPAGYRPDTDWLQAWQAAWPQLAGRKVLTLPGRITRLKGHESFIRLMAALKAAGEPVHGLIVGGAEARKQPYLAELQAAVQAAGLAQDISFTGLRSDIRDVFSVSDLVLSLSSQPESFGRTALEALSLGVPVVGWDHGGIGEILRRVHPAGAVPLNDMDGLVERVRAQLQAAPRSFAIPDDFRLETMCARTLALYRALAVRG
ncbi:MAG: glycosyltransferase family 4 protein [Rhodocyclaceae bacterium]